ncbi:telomere binding protein [Zalerion maritima]|uniref:Telomere binding protein n=1 Tax=Zalerion maritima TaxID=339359 RepID=A0AAD5WVF7_9PEZI|nr:telomere binding protein [Zalerion maritima]
MDFLLTSAGRSQRQRNDVIGGASGTNEEEKTSGEEGPFLRVVSSSVLKKSPGITEAGEKQGEGGNGGRREKGEEREKFTGSSAEEALGVLKNEPDHESLVECLRYLTREEEGDGGVAVARPTPTAAQISRVLAGEIVGNYWAMLGEGSAGRGPKKRKGRGAPGKRAERNEDTELVLNALRSVTGINALLLRLSALSKEAERGHREREKREDVALQINVLLEVMEGVLEGEQRLEGLWKRCAGAAGDKEMKRRVLWTQFMGLFSGEKIVGVCAEAEVMGGKHAKEDREGKCWVASGREFSAWKGRNLVEWTRNVGVNGEGDMKRVAELFMKSGRGVHGDGLVRHVLAELVLGNGTDLGPFKAFLGQLSTYEQQKTISGVLSLLAEKRLNDLGNANIKRKNPIISAAASLVKEIVGGDARRTEYLVSWLTSNSGAGLGDGVAIRRAVVAVLSEKRETVISALEKAMELFGDMIYVKHAPILQQEVHAQSLLLLAGHVDRLAHVKLGLLLRGTTFLASVSNRLTAPQIRARFLGMVVGEALSGLVDLGKKKLDFHMDETKTEEGGWYKSLVGVDDELGEIEPLVSPVEKSEAEEKPDKKPVVFGPPRPPPSKKAKTERKEQSKAKTKTKGKGRAPVTAAAIGRHPSMPKTGFIIEELDGDDEESTTKSKNNAEVEDSEDDDLTPYAKPPSDASDSEEDPTLLRRDKPKPPVYVRDLIAYFRATDDYDRQILALRTAPGLIRRKGKFGTEVTSHAETLAGLLVGVEDKFDVDSKRKKTQRHGEDDGDSDEADDESEDDELLDDFDFENLRIDALVGLIISGPEKMGPVMARMLWTGDYSTAQRRTILVSIGLAGRELAGLEGEKEAGFVSKRLPERLERMFLGDTQGGDMDVGGDGRASGRKGKNLRALPPTALEDITQDLTRKFLAPMAAEAADMKAGPDVLKLETYKERLASSEQAEEESRQLASASGGAARGAFLGQGKIIRKSHALTHPSSRSKAKAIPNTSANIICNSLFSPLSSRLVPTCLRSAAGNRIFAPVLPLAVRTIGVLLDAAGPNTLALPQMTGEAWDLLLAARAKCAGDLGVTGAVVEGLVVLLQVNGVGPGQAAAEGRVRHLCTNFGREINESMEWAGQVFEGLRGDGPEEGVLKGLGIGKEGGGRLGEQDRTEEARIKAMAAGVLVRLQEVSERFRGLMLGHGR